MNSEAIVNPPFQMMRAVLSVIEKTYISPNYIRITLEGDMSVYKNARVGDNNKIIIPDPVTKAINLDPFSSEKRPIIRTYTMRSIDYERNLMAIDFVAHGTEGPASAWAINAQKGEQLGVLMKTKTKPLFTPSDNYFLIADHTALPVVSVILEQLHDEAKGIAFIEIPSEKDILQLQKPEGIKVEWLINPHPGSESQLSVRLKQQSYNKDEQNYVFAAAEQTTIKKIQAYIKNEMKLDRNQWQAMSYWKYGKSEDASSAERYEVNHQ